MRRTSALDRSPQLVSVHRMAFVQPQVPNAKVGPGHPLFEFIEEAYRVFSYPRPQSTGVCELCCMDAKIEADFFNPKIAELPLNYVQDWYQGAYTRDEMPKATWAYLLPRILEILAADEDPSPIGREVSLNRFETGNPKNWSTSEWKILDRFQKAFLQREIARRTDFLDDTVCMFGIAGWSIRSLLEQITATPDEQLARRLWRDWCNCVPGRESVWISAFWESPDNSTVFDFYTSREIHTRIEAVALSDRSTSELAVKASAVVNVIEANANWVSQR